jgi:hypothetical protein
MSSAVRRFHRFPVVVLLLLAGCGVTRAYVGEPRQVSETALLTGMSPYDPFNAGITTKVLSVDGIAVDATKVELLPGTHMLEIYAAHNGGSGTRTVEAQFDAGMAYVIAMSTDREQLFAIVATGKR